MALINHEMAEAAEAYMSSDIMDILNPVRSTDGNTTPLDTSHLGMDDAGISYQLDELINCLGSNEVLVKPYLEAGLPLENEQTYGEPVPTTDYTMCDMSQLVTCEEELDFSFNWKVPPDYASLANEEANTVRNKQKPEQKVQNEKEEETDIMDFQHDAIEESLFEFIANLKPITDEKPNLEELDFENPDRGNPDPDSRNSKKPNSGNPPQEKPNPKKSNPGKSNSENPNSEKPESDKTSQERIFQRLTFWKTEPESKDRIYFLNASASQNDGINPLLYFLAKQGNIPLVITEQGKLCKIAVVVRGKIPEKLLTEVIQAIIQRILKTTQASASSSQELLPQPQSGASVEVASCDAARGPDLQVDGFGLAQAGGCADYQLPAEALMPFADAAMSSGDAAMLPANCGMQPAYATQAALENTPTSSGPSGAQIFAIPFSALALPQCFGGNQVRLGAGGGGGRGRSNASGPLRTRATSSAVAKARFQPQGIPPKRTGFRPILPRPPPVQTTVISEFMPVIVPSNPMRGGLPNIALLPVPGQIKIVRPLVPDATIATSDPRMNL